MGPRRAGAVDATIRPCPGVQGRLEGWFGDVGRVMAEVTAAPSFDEVRQLYGAAVHRFFLVVLGEAGAAETSASRVLAAAEAAYGADRPEPASVPVWLLGIACD